jgi:Ras-related protein Rab-18
LIGNSNVGKSSLLLRFTDDTFLPQEEVSATIGKMGPKQGLAFYRNVMKLFTHASCLGVDFKVSMMEVDGQTYKLTIWVR